MINSAKYGLLISVLIVLFGACTKTSRVVDWSPYYKIEYTEPYGLYVFNEEIEKIKPGFKKIERFKRGVQSSFRKELDETLSRTQHAPKTYVYIDESNKMNQLSRESIKELAYHGNHVFIATHNFEFEEFNNHFAFDYLNDFWLYKNEKKELFFEVGERAVKASSDRIRGLEYFEIKDDTWAIPLGYYRHGENDEKKCNFIALKYGDGIIFMHTNPEVFTNYFLLKNENSLYTQELLSHWTFREIKWFVNYDYEFDENYGILTYMLSQPGLKMAWYLLWILLLIAVFTYAKRTQRIIPVVLPKKNFSVAYAKRLAEFHLLQKNYHGLIDKQIVVLLDKLRNEYRMDTSQFDDHFAARMHALTNCDKFAAEDLVKFIKKHRVRSVAFDFDFEELRLILKRLKI